MALLKNGYQIASGSNDRTIKIWNLRDEVKTLSENNGPVRSIAVLNDDLLASASNDMTIKIW